MTYLGGPPPCRDVLAGGGSSAGDGGLGRRQLPQLLLAPRARADEAGLTAPVAGDARREALQAHHLRSSGSRQESLPGLLFTAGDPLVVGSRHGTLGLELQGHGCRLNQGRATTCDGLASWLYSRARLTCCISVSCSCVAPPPTCLRHRAVAVSINDIWT